MMREVIQVIYRLLLQYNPISNENVKASTYCLLGVMTVALCLGYFNSKRRLQQGILALYLYLVLSYTILARKVGTDYRVLEQLFWSYQNIIRGSIASYTENVMNCLMFFPLGFLIPAVFSNKGWKGIFASGFLLSLMIELIQLATLRGYFELDDLFHNTIGILSGYDIYSVICKRKKIDRVFSFFLMIGLFVIQTYLLRS